MQGIKEKLIGRFRCRMDWRIQRWKVGGKEWLVLMAGTGKQSHLSAEAAEKTGWGQDERRARIFGGKFRYTVFAGPRERSSEVGGGRWRSVAGERTRDSKSTPRVNSRRWQTMRGVTKALSSLRPTGCSVANIQSSVHSPLWKGKGSWRGGGTPSITWEIALALFMCVYTDTGCTRPGEARPGHATPRHATPRHSSLYTGYRWPDKEDINNAFCTNTRPPLSIGRRTRVHV